MVKVRDGQVAERPFYTAIGVSLAGERDILGLWAGSGGEGAKFWMSVLTDLRNRGIKDTFFVVCDGLKGCPRWCPMCGRMRWADLHHPSDPQHIPAHARQYWDELKATSNRSTPRAWTTTKAIQDVRLAGRVSSRDVE